MINNLAQSAISAALSGDWKKALEINKNILNDNSGDVEALNRLSRTYAEIGKLGKARQTAKQVLKLDPFNTIAEKSLARWKNLKRGETYTSGPSDARVFLEEPGKTKSLPLLHPGSKKVLAKLDSGDEVKLNTHSHRVNVTAKDGKYIGRLPDDLSVHLKKLIRFGNKYRVFIKSINNSEVRVFIRETKRAKKIADLPSFSSEKISYISFTPPSLARKKNVISGNDEE